MLGTLAIISRKTRREERLGANKNAKQMRDECVGWIQLARNGDL
jgi:hypothetical protein